MDLDFYFNYVKSYQFSNILLSLGLNIDIFIDFEYFF